MLTLTSPGNRGTTRESHHARTRRRIHVGDDPGGRPRHARGVDGSPDMTQGAAAAITAGRTALGIELGSTRIKAVLIGPDHAPLAVGSHDWENQFVDRLWTYSLDAVWTG